MFVDFQLCFLKESYTLAYFYIKKLSTFNFQFSTFNFQFSIIY